jgi:hypothetical protein
MISPGCRDPALATDLDSYLYFSRTTSNLKQEADLILAFCARYGWESLVLWHSDSKMGGGLSSVLASSSLEVVDVPVPANDIGTETKRSLTRILTLRLRIIVVHAEPFMARLMMSAARNAGILNGHVRSPSPTRLCPSLLTHSLMDLLWWRH